MVGCTDAEQCLNEEATGIGGSGFTIAGLNKKVSPTACLVYLPDVPFDNNTMGSGQRE